MNDKDTTEQPSTTGLNGRDDNGRFAQGNQFAKGNPHAKAVGRFRAALLEALTVKEFTAIAKALIRKAKAGDVVAIRELFDRVFGRPPQAFEITADIDAPRVFRTPIRGPSVKA